MAKIEDKKVPSLEPKSKSVEHLERNQRADSTGGDQIARMRNNYKKGDDKAVDPDFDFMDF